MKSRFTDCLHCMIGSDEDKLDILLSKQYRKFIKLYRIIESYSEDIDEIFYDPSDDDTLEVQLSTTFTKKQLSSVVKKLTKYIDDHDINGYAKVQDSIIVVSISMEET